MAAPGRRGHAGPGIHLSSQQAEGWGWTLGLAPRTPGLILLRNLRSRGRRDVPIFPALAWKSSNGKYQAHGEAQPCPPSFSPREEQG